MAKRKLHVMVAYDRNRGIGYQNDLPWPSLPTDKTVMRTITSETTNSDKQNAVIMGRRTWESIPAKYRPLKKRYNVVLSTRRSEDIPKANLVCPSLTEALSKLQTPPLSEKIEEVYIMGGSRVYEEALAHPQCGLVYCTEILAEFPCDTFIPALDLARFTPVDCDKVPQGIIEENEVKYKFVVYKQKDS